jgi:hypothetical protein
VLSSNGLKRPATLADSVCHGGKMLSTEQADDDSGYVFVAKIDNARNVSTILKAIHFKDVSVFNQFVVVIWLQLREAGETRGHY